MKERTVVSALQQTIMLSKKLFFVSKLIFFMFLCFYAVASSLVSPLPSFFRGLSLNSFRPAHHASLCSSYRLYSPFPWSDWKEVLLLFITGNAHSDTLAGAGSVCFYALNVNTTTTQYLGEYALMSNIVSIYHSRSLSFMSGSAA